MTDIKISEQTKTLIEARKATEDIYLKIVNAFGLDCISKKTDEAISELIRQIDNDIQESVILSLQYSNFTNI